MSLYLTPSEVSARGPERVPAVDPVGDARRVLKAIGQWNANQQMGLRWAVACVALEITQRCNLDCTLCYLSEHSEAVRDLPLQEVYRRIDRIRRQYGPRTDVQVTGGDPTLRNHDELVAIVARIRERGMRATLMTNGIRARRPLLERLAAAGLTDVAFHVDTTQQIKGFETEMQLNELRETYIDRTAGLPISVMFNTTVHAGNFHEIPDLVGFFVRHAGRVRTVSFQLQADTGRGVDRCRADSISIETVTAQIERGTGVRINFEACRTGHSSCNRYALCVAANGRLFNLFDDTRLFGRLQRATRRLKLDRSRPVASGVELAGWFLLHPRHFAAAIRWVLPKLRKHGKEILAARGRVRTLSFLIHNFMDAGRLECDRIDACAFKVMTSDGPMSMCLHNAKRDAHILRPVKVAGSPGGYWQPLSGKIADRAEPSTTGPDTQPLRKLKGRARARRMREAERSASCDR